MVYEQEPDIILLTESWCNDSITNSQLNLFGYYIDPELRVDRLDTNNGIGGGLLVYCKVGLNITPIPNSSSFNQYIQFSVKNTSANSSDITLTLIYRSPNSTNDNTKLLCDIINSSPSNSLIVGDFNLPSIDWNNCTSDNKSRKLLDAVQNKFLTQVINFPTHSRGNILDLALTDMPDKIVNVETLGNLGSSDHSLIRIDVLFSATFIRTNEKILDWRNANVEGLSEYLYNIDWDTEMSNLNTDKSWSFLCNKIDESIARFVPKTERRKKHRPCWINKQVSKLSHKKQRLWKIYVKHRCNETLAKYKEAEKELKRVVRNCKRNFETEISKSENKKKFYSYINSKTKNVVPVGPLKVDSIIITSDVSIANHLNEYFCTVFTDENLNNIPVIPDTVRNSKLMNIYIDINAVERKIDNLKQSSSAGPDGITSRFLQMFKCNLSLPLCIIYNKSLYSGDVPDDWRKANITPIFKKGSKSESSNYRPISLTSVPCKMLESLIKDAVMEHLILNNLITDSQHGFMKKRSCLTNLLQFFEYVTCSIDNNIPVDAIYLDFSKAFDKVPHQRLLYKLKSNHVDGNILRWIAEWLRNRRQRVVINGSESMWGPVKSGVPQGSVLGPLLFIIFINDIDLAASDIGIMNKFADDTKLGQSVNSDCDRQKLQTCLNKLCDWASAWGMKFNEKKCNVVHFGKNNPRFDYFMNNVKLNNVTDQKDVGININYTLKSANHCSEIAKRANAILGQLCRSFHYRDRFTFINLYKTYVRCHLEYCSPAWSPSSQSDIDILERVQKRAVGMVSGLISASYEDKIKELGLQTLAQRRERIDMIQTFKILNRVDDVDYQTWFEHVNVNRATRTRLTACPMNLVINRTNRDIRKSFFSQRVINTWNKLPIDVKSSPNLTIFKYKYDQIFM